MLPPLASGGSVVPGEASDDDPSPEAVGRDLRLDRAGLSLAGADHLPANGGDALLQRARRVAAGAAAVALHPQELRRLLPEILLSAADLVVAGARLLDY